MAKRQPDKLSGLEELFTDLWDVPRFAAGLRRGYRPNLDCYSTESPPEVTVIMEIPGIDPDRVQIVAEGRRLRIMGERRRPRCEGQVYYRSEIVYGPFERELEVGEDVDVDAAVATYERGLLMIKMPIAPRPVSGRALIDVRRS
jgi:HSP20 family molecular chaperone IbpA